MPVPRLVLRARRGMVILALPASLHLSYLVLALVLAVATFGFAEAGIPPLGVALTLVCLLAAGYDERWVIDQAKRRITRLWGLPVLPFLARRRHWSFDELAGVELTSFVRGSQPAVPGSGQPAGTGGSQTPPGSQPGPSLPGLRRYRRLMASLALVSTQGERIVVEQQSGRQGDQLRHLGRELARLLQVTYSEA